MKRVWKWVIGIVIVLVIVAVLVGGALLMRSHYANLANIPNLNRHVQVPRYDDGQRLPGRFPGMMPYGGYGMHMRGFGMMGYGRGLFGGLIGGLFMLGLLALLVLGIIWLVRRLRLPLATPVAVATTPAPVTPLAEPSRPVATVHPCPNCGEPVQDGWKHCPNCGTLQ